MNFLISHFHLLLEKLGQQIALVAISSGLAIIIGVIAGIVVIRIRKLKTLIISVANILQTIPSIALLGFLLPFFGIGAKPAIIALIVYALLPIVRNTISGIENVPKANKEAAIALGFTPWQQLVMVELPLALPVIMAGIRTAVVMSAGIATIAAFIGAGGLGDFIYQGLAVNSNDYILLGAIPAALLALTLDYLLSLVERYFSNKRKAKSRKNTLLWIVILILIVSLVIKFTFFPTQEKNKIVIGSKNFPEQLILGNLMADMIQSRTHLHVVKQFNLGTTSILQNAIVKGSVDIYPEYTGTAYLIVLKDKYNTSMTEKKLYQAVKTQYLKRFHLVWLSPFGYNNSNTILVKGQLARQYQLSDISDLHKISKLIIAAPQDFIKRPDGLIGLQTIYHLKFAAIKPMTPELTFQAIVQNDVNVIVGFSTDGRIKAFHLKALKDNKHLYPTYYAAPVVRESVLKKFPQIKPALAPLAGLINNEAMQHLNYLVSIKHQTPATVARAFLIKKKLLSPKA